jgi:hypothetical protein
MAAWIHKNLRYKPDMWVIPNDMVRWRPTMTGFAVLAGISFIGFMAALSWVVLVSIGIRRDDPGSVFKASSADPNGVVPDRMARIARRSTGVHWA